MTLNAGQLGASTILGAALAGHDLAGRDISASDIEPLEHGAAATVELPGGDRYRVTVEWLGDHEGAPA